MSSFSYLIVHISKLNTFYLIELNSATILISVPLLALSIVTAKKIHSFFPRDSARICATLHQQQTTSSRPCYLFQRQYTVKPEVYGAQPLLELHRQYCNYRGWCNTSNVEFAGFLEPISLLFRKIFETFGEKISRTS